jgi:hypothetical protein
MVAFLPEKYGSSQAVSPGSCRKEAAPERPRPSHRSCSAGARLSMAFARARGPFPEVWSRILSLTGILSLAGILSLTGRRRFRYTIATNKTGGRFRLTFVAFRDSRDLLSPLLCSPARPHPFTAKTMAGQKAIAGGIILNEPRDRPAAVSAVAPEPIAPLPRHRRRPSDPRSTNGSWIPSSRGVPGVSIPDFSCHRDCSCLTSLHPFCLCRLFMPIVYAGFAGAFLQLFNTVKHAYGSDWRPSDMDSEHRSPPARNWIEQFGNPAHSSRATHRWKGKHSI